MASALLAACGAGTASIVVDGRPRDYRLHLPPRPPAGPMPLVIAFHGGGGNARQMERATRFDALADREGFAVVYPDSVNGHWNDGRVGGDALPVDDVAFVRALIAAIEARYPIDPGRVFATGISNGAMMSYRVGCELADRIAAIAPVVGAMPAAYAPNCHPARPISLLAMNGTADPIVPWAGGQVHVLRDRGAVLGAEASVALVAAAVGCADPATGWDPDRDPGDGTRVRRTRYRCPPGVAIELDGLDGGGHTWPGGTQYLPAAIVGRVSRELSATDAVWQFFASHGR